MTTVNPKLLALGGITALIIIIYVSISFYLEEWNPLDWSFEENQVEYDDNYDPVPTNDYDDTDIVETGDKKKTNKKKKTKKRSAAKLTTSTSDRCSNPMSHTTFYDQYPCKKYNGYVNPDGPSYDTFEEAREACDNDRGCNGVYITNEDRVFRTSTGLACKPHPSSKSGLEAASQTLNFYDYIAIKPDVTCCNTISDQGECTPEKGCRWDSTINSCKDNFMVGELDTLSRTGEPSGTDDSSMDFVVTENEEGDKKITNREKRESSEDEDEYVLDRDQYIRFSNIMPLHATDFNNLSLEDFEYMGAEAQHIIYGGNDPDDLVYLDESSLNNIIRKGVLELDPQIETEWEKYQRQYAPHSSTDLTSVAFYCTNNQNCKGIVESIINGTKYFSPVHGELLCRKTYSQEFGTEQFRLKYDPNDPFTRSMYLKNEYWCLMNPLPCGAYADRETCEANDECTFEKMKYIEPASRIAFPQVCRQRSVVDLNNNLYTDASWKRHLDLQRMRTQDEYDECIREGNPRIECIRTEAFNECIKKPGKTSEQCMENPHAPSGVRS